MSYTKIEDLVSPWDLIALWSIYSQKKRIEESFMMVIEESFMMVIEESFMMVIEESFMIVIEANDYIKWFLRYQWLSV